MKCPVCKNGELVFEAGYPSTREEPGEPDVLYCTECDAVDQEIEKYMIFNLNQLAEKIGCEVDRIAKVIYKNTDCGCTFSSDENGITVGGYAEGFDGDIPYRQLFYPFFISDFWETLKQADEDGSRVWECVNKHEDGCTCALE